MNAMKWRVMLAGVFAACAMGGIALRVAWATAGSGVTSTVMSGAILLDEIDTKGESDADEVEIKTKGLWETRVVRFRITPGGHTGWHSHPGPVFVMITAGTMTLEQSDGSVADYPTGTGFVEDARRVHIARNEGDVDLELDAFFLVPLGAPLRIDEPAP